MLTSPWPIAAATFRQHRRSMISWMAGLGAFGVVMLALYPSVKGNHDFAKLLASYPEALQKLFALSDYTTPTGYLRAEVFSFLAPLLVSLFAVFLGADLIAGEEGRGTLEILAASPVARRRIFAEQFAALIVMVSGVALVLGFVLFLGGRVVHLQVATVHLLSATVAMAVLACVVGTLALVIGAATGKRGLALSVGAVVLVGSYLLSQLASLVPFLVHFRGLSPWWHALGVDPLTKGLLPWHLLGLLAALALLSAVGAMLFDRRDLGIES